MAAELPGRVGVNAIFLAPWMGGLVTYVEELVPELIRAAPRTRFSIYTSADGAEHLRRVSWAGEVGFVTHPLFGTQGLKAIAEMTVLGALASRREDVIHSVALTAPIATRAANVITIADTTWFHGAGPDPTTRLWRTVVPPLARRADRVIAISQASRRDVIDDLRVPADRVDLTLLGHRPAGEIPPTDEAELRARHDLGERPLVLMVGTRKPHKNVEGLLRGFALLAAADPEPLLVLAGNPTALESSLRALTDELGVADRVRFLEFVAPEELEGLYAAAAIVVLASFNEGFGLPVLEAMARGVAVVCSAASSLPEVGGDAALYFDPHRPDELAQALTRLLGDPALRTRLGREGRERARTMTWRQTAEGTLESYARGLVAARARARR